MDVIWAILCEKSINDRESNNISLINIIEEISVSGPSLATLHSEEDQAQLPQNEEESAEQLPLMPIRGELVIMWTRSEVDVGESGTGRISVIPPIGEPQRSNPVQIDLTQFLRLRLRSILPGIPAAGEGIYQIVVEARNNEGQWEKKFSTPLRVTVQPTGGN